jgi:hypothetical protein
LIAQEDMLSFFDDAYFESQEALIIHAYGSNHAIIPSLSFNFKRTKTKFSYLVFPAIKDFYKYIRDKLTVSSGSSDHNIIEFYQDLLRLNPEINIKYYEDSQILVIAKHDSFFLLPDLDTIITFLFLCKRNSLNILNSSYSYTKNDLTNLEKKFSKSIAATARAFSTFFSSAYKNITTHLCSKNYETGKWSILEDDGHFDAESLNSREKLIAYSKPVYLKENGLFVLILPFCNDRRSYFVKHLLIVESAERIPKYIVTNFLKFVNNYFNAFLEKAKRAVLNKMQGKIIDIQNEHKFLNSNFDLTHELEKFVGDAFDEVVVLTNAISATLRLYDPNKKSLDLLVERVENNEVTRGISIEKTKSIPLSNSESVNVQTFKFVGRGAKEDHIYVPDMKKRGLKSRNSNSELCFPLFFKKVKIGVVNFESPNINGFDPDSIKYLRDIRNLIQNFYIQLLEINDKIWLSRRTQIYQNYHEIENIINSDPFPEKYRNELKSLLHKQHISMGEEYDYFKQFRRFKEDFFRSIKNHLPTDSYDQFYHNVRVRIVAGAEDISIKKFVIDSLLIVFKNILTNQQKYADNSRDKITILINQDSVYFNVTSSRPLLHLNSRNYLMAPFETLHTAEFKITHYGLFIIGMLARQLGGFPYIYFNEEQCKTCLKISIPLQKSWKQTPYA